MMNFLLLLFFSCLASASPLAIYGEDNRQDVFASTNPLFKNLASTTAALIEKSNLEVIGTQTMIQGPSFSEMYKLCPQERFRAQPVAANCSGTLIRPDIIMTAGHCYDLAREICKNSVWVFDYKVAKENQKSVTVSNDKVYECQEVILKELNVKTNRDFALIKLKRVVSDRNPAKLRLLGEVKKSDPLVMIGHPRGLPTKITDEGYVLDIHDFFFYSNLDAFTINSGSGVFHAETGLLMGILTGGSMDFSSQNGCTTSKTYSMSEGKEIVTKIDFIREFLKNSNL